MVGDESIGKKPTLNVLSDKDSENYRTNCYSIKNIYIVLSKLFNLRFSITEYTSDISVLQYKTSFFLYNKIILQRGGNEMLMRESN